MEIEYIVYFQEIYFVQVSSGESVHVILVRGLKVSMLQILKASFLRIKCAVEVWCLFGICSGKKKELAK